MLRKLIIFLSLFLIIAPRSFASEIVLPDAAVENAAANALLNSGIALHKKSPEIYDDEFTNIAIALARLGRTQSALKVVDWISEDPQAQTRGDVLRLSVRRSALAGDVSRAADLLYQITNSNAKADALLTVARAYLRRNDYTAAQKVLFQVTPQVPQNFDVLLYTAYLFSQAGNRDVAKRLFNRAEKMTAQPGNNSVNVELYLLKSDLLDEWRVFHDGDSKQRTTLDARVLEALLKADHIDTAIAALRQTPLEMQTAGLLITGYYIAPKYPNRAASLFDEASKMIPQAAQNIAQTQNDISAAKAKQAFYFPLLIWGYDKVGEKQESQKWLQRLQQETPKEEIADVMLTYHTFPLMIFPEMETERTFPPDQLRQINDAIQPYLPKLRGDRKVITALSVLVSTQIAAGQTKEAYGNLEFLEADVRQKMAEATSDFDLNDALSIAKQWQRAGNGERSDAILRDIFNNPREIPGYSKETRLNEFVSRGFVDEALRLFHTLPEDKHKSPQSVLPNLPAALAIHHPDQFPYDMLKDTDPRAEATNISEFVKSLTAPIFQAPDAREFIVTANGSSEMAN